MLRSLQKSVRPALSSSWRSAQAPTVPSLGLANWSLPSSAQQPSSHRNPYSRSFHKSVSVSEWANDVSTGYNGGTATTPKGRSAPADATTRFVGIWNLPRATTEEEVHDYLFKTCKLSSQDVSIRFSPNDRNGTVNVFLDLPTIQLAQKALDIINATEFYGVSVSASSSRGPRSPNGRTNTVVIGNIGREVRQEDLEQYMKEQYPGVIAARVAEVRVPAVFVEFESEEQAARALEEIKGIDVIETPSGQRTHRIFSTFANRSHGAAPIANRRAIGSDTASVASDYSFASRASSARGRRVRDGATSGSQVPTNRLWIGNLPNSFAEVDFKGMVNGLPGLRKLYLPESQDSSKKSAWARIDFHDIESASSARSQLQGAVFAERELLVEFSPAPPPRPSYR